MLAFLTNEPDGYQLAVDVSGELRIQKSRMAIASVRVDPKRDALGACALRVHCLRSSSQ
jgi:hypothetical protein